MVIYMYVHIKDMLELHFALLQSFKWCVLEDNLNEYRSDASIRAKKVTGICSCQRDSAATEGQTVSTYPRCNDVTNVSPCEHKETV